MSLLQLPALKRRWILIAVLFVTGCTILYNFNPTDYILMPKCMFKLVTGYDCPGCGFQRAMHAVLHGHIREAIQYNFFLLLAIPYLFILIIIRYALPPTKNTNKWIVLFESRTAIRIYVSLFFAWFLIRNILNI